MDRGSDNTEKGALGEHFVNEIAYNSFLKYWCYPGPTDQDNSNKEICDLLIIFKSACVIVSVKNYTFSENYQRYFRKTTERAMRQIIGAERKLFGKKSIFLRHPDREPEIFDKSTIKNVYRIIVNLNTAVKLYQTAFFEQGKQFVVMDALAWHSALTILDTLPDFLNYINNRFLLTNQHAAIILPRAENDFSEVDAQFAAELLFKIPKNGKVTIISGTEMDLIATYMRYGHRFPKELYQDTDFNFLSMRVDGEWDKFSKSAAFTEVKEKLSDSYYIDDLVKQTFIHVENGDKLAKMLFSMNRMQRSLFSKHFHEFHSREQQNQFGYRPMYYAKLNPKFVFLYFRDDYPEDLLKGVMNILLLHMNYLYNFSIDELGLLGKAHSSSRYAIGYSTNRHKPSAEEIGELEDGFKSMNLKLRSELPPGALDDSHFISSTIFTSPF